MRLLVLCGDDDTKTHETVTFLRNHYRLPVDVKTWSDHSAKLVEETKIVVLLPPPDQFNDPRVAEWIASDDVSVRLVGFDECPDHAHVPRSDNIGQALKDHKVTV